MYLLARSLDKLINRIETSLAQKISHIDNYTYKLSKKRLQKLMKNETSIKDTIQTIEKYRGYWIYKNINAWQIPSEINKLITLIRARANKEKINTLEIGTYRGGLVYLFSRTLILNKLITIDLPRSHSTHKEKLFRLFNKEIEINCLIGNSHNKNMLKKVKNILNGEKLYLLFIDGDHSYDGVKQDFELYSPLVKKSGIIAFHDITHPKLGVKRFWEEIKDHYKTQEIIAPSNEMKKFARSKNDQNGWAGIGVLYVD